MSFEILHFRNADKILEKKGMEREIPLTMEYLNDVLYGTFRRSELLRQALEEMDWRPKGDLNILDGRRYFYKGIRNRVAIDGSFSSYEFVQDGLMRLQIGRDKGKIDMGILLLTSLRSEKSPYGRTKQLVEQEVEYLYPTISIPVTVVLFDLGKPGLLSEMGAGNQRQTEERKNDPAVQNSQGDPADPAPGPDRNGLQEKDEGIDREGVSTSRVTRMRHLKGARKKVKRAPVSHVPALASA